MKDEEIISRYNELVSNLVETQKYLGKATIGDYSNYALNIYYNLINEKYQAVAENIEKFKADIVKFLTNGPFTTPPKNQLEQLKRTLENLEISIKEKTKH